MPTPLSAVVKSPLAANILAQHFESAEEAAGHPDSALLAIHKVGPSAVQQLRAWQLAQDPSIPIPQDPFGPDGVERLRQRDDFFRYAASFLKPLCRIGAEDSARRERIRVLAESLYRELVVLGFERNLPDDFPGLRRLATDAAEAFYPAPAGGLTPSGTLEDDVEPAEASEAQA